MPDPIEVPDPIRIALISLGCPKNLVDSEVLLAHLSGDGIQLTPELEEAHVIIVNTCAFIDQAREESIDTLFGMARLKEEGHVRGVIAVGCLPQRYRDELIESLPEVDAFLPISDYSSLAEVVRRVAAGDDRGEVHSLAAGKAKSGRSDMDRFLLTPSSYAYLRVAEGCNHQCSFCAIPMIRGGLKSKPLAILREEAERLVGLGVKELILVAEDTTAWGADLPGREGLPELLEALAEVKGCHWIRILYGYPWSVSDRLLTAMRTISKVVPYLDLPIQHISDPVLKAMHRGAGGEKLKELLYKIREEVPGVVLRTSVLVGHPHETERRYLELLDFLGDFRFERLGAFTFSPEEGTAAAAMTSRPSRKAARQRRDRIMALQQEVVAKWHASFKGRDLTVLVDDKISDSEYEGRTFADAPEVDCLVRVQSTRESAPGDLITVRIDHIDGYDMAGRAIY